MDPDGGSLLTTELPGVRRYSRGKVRDIYDLGEDRLLIVATDRISAFDVVLPNGIPHKGAVLTQLSAHWFGRTGHLVPNHMLSTSVAAMPESLWQYEGQLAGRSMLVRRVERIDVECVVRGYVAGSAWAEYRRNGTVGEEALPAGLVESERLSEPLFTPATKAASGHDQNIGFRTLANLVGSELAQRLRETSIALYLFAEGVARQRGIIIADTKMEFGLREGELILIDELLTPDSSRFWPADQYGAGRGQPSFDKQFVRDWLEASGWNKEPPAPVLPGEIVARTAAKYVEAYERLTGRVFGALS